MCVRNNTDMIGGEWRINAHTSGTQNSGVTTTLGDDRFVVAWASDEQDGDGYGIFGRAFGTPPTDLAELQSQEVSGPAVTYLWRTWAAWMRERSMFSTICSLTHTGSRTTQ